jgi:hypothetical protein
MMPTPLIVELVQARAQLDAAQPQLDPAKLRHILRRKAERARKERENRERGFQMKRGAK